MSHFPLIHLSTGHTTRLSFSDIPSAARTSARVLVDTLIRTGAAPLAAYPGHRLSAADRDGSIVVTLWSPAPETSSYLEMPIVALYVASIPSIAIHTWRSIPAASRGDCPMPASVPWAALESLASMQLLSSSPSWMMPLAQAIAAEWADRCVQA